MWNFSGDFSCSAIAAEMYCNGGSYAPGLLLLPAGGGSRGGLAHFLRGGIELFPCFRPTIKQFNLKIKVERIKRLTDHLQGNFIIR